MKSKTLADERTFAQSEALISEIPADAWMFCFEPQVFEIDNLSSPPRSAWATYLRVAVLTLLEFDADIRAAAASRPGKILFVAVDDKGLIDEPMIQDSEPFQGGALRALLLDATRIGSGQEGILLDDPRAGQIRATVLRLDSVSGARKLFEQIQRGGGKSVLLRRRVERKIIEAIDELLAASGGDFDSDAKSLKWVFGVMRERIAKDMEEKLNEAAAARPHATYEEKKELAKWINGELRSLSLAIKDPKSGRACHIVGDKGNRPEIGRFMLNYIGQEGRLIHSTTSVALPRLEVMAEDLTATPVTSKSARSR